MIEIDDLSKSFGDFTALDAINLKIESGEVFGLLGPNGAGKSTLIRTLLGFLTPTSGKATVSGFDCRRQRVAVHRLISYLPGDARLHSLMRAKKVLQLYCQFRETASFERALVYADRLDLDLNRWVGLMSTGMRQKLALAITFAADVPILILDEPTANLDPTVRGNVLDVVNEARKQKRTVIFSSHVLSEIEQTCDRVGILRAGKLVHVESISTLNRQHRIRGRLADGTALQPPPELASRVTIKQVDNEVEIETSVDLSEVFRWLAEVRLANVHVLPVGLRSTYDRFHFPHKINANLEVPE